MSHQKRRRSLRVAGLAGAALAIIAMSSAGGCSAGKPGDINDNGGKDGSSVGDPCSTPATGCPCAPVGIIAACGKVIQQDGNYVTCSEGHMTCDGTKWGACAGDHIVVKSIPGTSVTTSAGGIHVTSNPVPCTNLCDPNGCNSTAGGGSDIDAAGVSIGDAGVSIAPVTTGGDGAVGDGGTCQGLQCQVDFGCSASNSKTTLTGTVYDPVMQNPLYNAYVYIPIDPDPSHLPAFTSGATCDACSGTSLNAVAVAQTDVNGKFTLTNVPTTAKAPNNPIPLVVQMGKWRRVQMLTTVADCATTAVPPANSRLPRNQFDGYNNKADIPRMAIASGSADPFECMMLKMGIDPAEFQLPGSGTRRIDFYNANGLQYVGGNAPDYSTLVGSTASMKPYDVVLLPCEGTEDDNNDTYADFVANYTLAGGRMFTTHYGYTWLATPSGGSAQSTNPVTGNPNIFFPVATWNFDFQANSATGQIDTNFPKGATFQTWMDQLPAPNNGVVTNGSFLVNSPRHDLDSVNTKYATQWMHDTTWQSPKTLHMTFNTPLGAGLGDAGADAGAGVCGRVVYSDFHVSTSDIIQTTTCATNADCGYGSTCNAAGTPGTCQQLSCYTPSDCGDTNWTCPGATAGACSRGLCATGSDCHNGGTKRCIAGRCGCNSDADCGNTGTCNVATHVCSFSGACSVNRDCRGSGQAPDGVCNAGTTGTCTPNGCASSATCNGEVCSGGKCGGCFSDNDCPGASTCVGGVSPGTCTGNAGQFPMACAQGPLTAQESALEFMLLDLTACISPDNAPPPPPPPPVTIYPPVTFTVDFDSICQAPQHVRWREFDWQAQIPNGDSGASGASINFKAQTAATQATLGAAQLVPVFNATTSTTLPNYDVAILDTGTTGVLRTAAPPVASQEFLRMTITLNPSTDKSQTPTLIQWKVQYDCVDAE